MKNFDQFLSFKEIYYEKTLYLVSMAKNLVEDLIITKPKIF